LQVERWNTDDSIEANYSLAEVAQILFFAELIGAWSVVSIAGLAEDVELAERVGAAINAHVSKCGSKPPT
jgi:hypothetical protein